MNIFFLLLSFLGLTARSTGNSSALNNTNMRNTVLDDIHGGTSEVQPPETEDAISTPRVDHNGHDDSQMDQMTPFSDHRMDQPSQGESRSDQDSDQPNGDHLDPFSDHHGHQPVNGDPTMGHDHDDPDETDPPVSQDHGHDDGHSGHDGHGTGSTVAPPIETATQAEIEAFVAEVTSQPEMHFHQGDSSKMGEHMAAMGLTPRDEATHIAVKNGDWFDPSTWYNGEIPDGDAKVLIPESVHVTYGSVSDESLFTVRVDGTLDFDTDADSRIVFDTMVVSPTGKLVIGTEENPVDSDHSVELIIASNGPIDTDWDPMLLSRGIIAHGETSIHGAKTDSHEKVIDDPMAGDTSVTFETLPEGWEVGDKIVIAGTRYDGYKWDNAIGAKRLYPAEDEVRTITEVDGNTVHFDDPLVHDHDTPRADLKTSVANYTRNVSIETEDAMDVEVSERGHVMFMHSDKVDVRYAEFHELGRTDKSELSQNVSDFNDIQSDSNVQGRYSVHLHRTGVDDLDNPAQIIGNTVWGSPGWGFVHHDSNAILDNNASFDTFGAGFVAETGNETGSWNDNIAIGATGINWSTPKNSTEISQTIFDTAKGGHGFWFQGRLVDSTDNVAASVNTGFVYFHRDGDNRVIDVDSSLFDYPAALNYGSEVAVDDVPILLFDGNETFAAREGLHIVKANPNQGHDVWSHLNDFTAWSVKSGAHIEYTSHYLLTDFDLIGKDATQFSEAATGISFGNNTSEIVVNNSNISDFKIGIDLKKNFVGNNDGTIDQHDYVIIDTEIRNAETEYGDYDPAHDRIIDSENLLSKPIDIEFDGPLVYQEAPTIFSGGGVKFDGVKSDGLGETPFPGGTDTFQMTRPEVSNILETQGYWTTTDGRAYFLADIYTTDRLSGEIFYETHPVFIEDDVVPKLGNKFFEYSGAVDNGTQDFTTSNGETYAGGAVLDKATLADPVEAPIVTTSEAQEVWDMLTGHMDALPEHDHTNVDHVHDDLMMDIA